MQTSSPSDGGGLREELRSDAQTVTHSAKEKLRTELDARKGTAATQAKSLSTALDKTANELSDSPDWLRSAFQQGAQTLQRFAETIERKDARQLTRDVEQLARDNPGTFLAGCALAGFAAARVLKAGIEDTSAHEYRGPGSAQPYDPYHPTRSEGPGSAFSGMPDSAMTTQSPYQGER